MKYWSLLSVTLATMTMAAPATEKPGIVDVIDALKWFELDASVLDSPVPSESSDYNPELKAVRTSQTTDLIITSTQRANKNETFRDSPELS